jgi:hypothetical protein
MLYAAVVLAAPGGVAVPPRLLAGGVGGVQRVFCRGHLVAGGIETGARWLAITSRPPSSPARLGDPPRWRAPTGGLPVTGSSIAAADPVVSTSSDHAAITVHLTAW